MAFRPFATILLILVVLSSIFTSVFYFHQSIPRANMVAYGTTTTTISEANENSSEYMIKIAPPEIGVYHGANPGFGGSEDEVTADRIIDYQEISGKKLAWAYFSNNWIEDIEFPQESVETIDSLDVVPFIRMMPRTTFDQQEEDPVFTLQGIIDGDFDESLIDWAHAAKSTNIPLMVEFGTEVNGDWFPWSGLLNGGGETDEYGDPNIADGPERFRDAYRHIIDLFRNEEVNNITWVFHVFPFLEDSTINQDEESWNNVENYYPGDDYIDWIGTSVYGSIEPEKEWNSFREIMDRAYKELESISDSKPFAILELGIIEDPEMGNKSEWIQEALHLIENGTYPRVKAISYWNEKWENDGDIIDLTIDSTSDSLSTYRELISSPFFISSARSEYN
ncbi:conserved protein of unknown function [Candidatus Nitrosocosmicus franklandus]|uniref:GH26 domain-containing protein n=2 Tax=Candidatus Nitrosocosmicus franklandianus TaxID=1798806 RepID=A0A484I7N0_9ARCH|nr:conserved protein of unknown function [Candidatus Nitrosocosmicus franklandus]